MRSAIKRMEQKHPGSLHPWVKEVLVGSPEIEALEVRPTKYVSGKGMFFSQAPQLGDALRYVAVWFMAEAHREAAVSKEDVVRVFVEAYQCPTRNHLQKLATSKGLKLYPKNTGLKPQTDFTDLEEFQTEVERLARQEPELVYLQEIQRLMGRFKPFVDPQRIVLHCIDVILKGNREHGSEIAEETSEKAIDQFEAARKLLTYYGRFPSIPHMLSRVLSGWNLPVMFAKHLKMVNQMIEKQAVNRVDLQRILQHLEFLAHREGESASEKILCYRNKLAGVAEKYPVVAGHMNDQVERLDALSRSILDSCVNAVRGTMLYALLEAKLEE